MKNNGLYIYTFYRFINIKNKAKIKILLDKYFKENILRGTVLIASEGINASISGTKYDLEETIKTIKKILKIRKLNIKVNSINFLPFKKIKVRLKKEIVSLGKGKLNLSNSKNTFIEPKLWNELLKKNNLKLIDTRNTYEVSIGKFSNAINPLTNSFREFPQKFKNLKLKKEENIALYCTGGIRCEKATSFLIKKGYKNVFQLKGGILNYLNFIKNQNDKSMWEGECFVFDDRVTVNKQLLKGEYDQCYACRMPISKKEVNSKLFIKGVQCPHCFQKKSRDQLAKYSIRQKQIDKAEINKTNHSFKKIYKN